MNATTIEQSATTEVSRPDFGAGRYSALMESVYEDAMSIFKLESKPAEKLARQVGSDYGAAMANVPVTSRVSKSVSKDGKVTLSEAAKVKVTMTNSLFAMRAIAYANEAGKFGFKWSTTKWAVTDGLQKYFDTLQS